MTEATATEKKPDLFDSADFYDCSDEGETLRHEDVRSALDYVLDNRSDEQDRTPTPITLYAYARKAVTPRWLDNAATWMLEDFEQRWSEDYGPGDDAAFTPAEEEQIKAQIRALIAGVAAVKRVYQCERVAHRSFTVAEIKKLLGEEEESQPVSGAV